MNIPREVSRMLPISFLMKLRNQPKPKETQQEDNNDKRRRHHHTTILTTLPPLPTFLPAITFLTVQVNQLLILRSQMKDGRIVGIEMMFVSPVLNVVIFICDGDMGVLYRCE
jgi:hypothetical protein